MRNEESQITNPPISLCPALSWAKRQIVCCTPFVLRWHGASILGLWIYAHKWYQSPKGWQRETDQRTWSDGPRGLTSQSEMELYDPQNPHIPVLLNNCVSAPVFPVHDFTLFHPSNRWQNTGRRVLQRSPTKTPWYFPTKDVSVISSNIKE